MTRNRDIANALGASIVAGTLTSSGISAGVDSDLVDSAYVQSRVTLRDSSFVTGVVDSNYVSARASVTTSSVTTAYAGITPLAVGSMITCNNFNSNPGSTINIGGTIAGSYLSGINYNNGGYYNIGATGTWKNMGGMRVKYNQGYAPSLFMRIA